MIKLNVTILTDRITANWKVKFLWLESCEFLPMPDDTSIHTIYHRSKLDRRLGSIFHSMQVRFSFKSFKCKSISVPKNPRAQTVGWSMSYYRDTHFENVVSIAESLLYIPLIYTLDFVIKLTNSRLLSYFDYNKVAAMFWLLDSSTN